MIRSILALLALLSLAGCNPCADSKTTFLLSPSGKLSATTSESCERGSGYKTTVDVHPAGREASAENIAFSHEGRADVRAIWKSDTVLLIDCRNCDAKQTIVKRPSIGEVAVEYSFK